MLFNPFIKSERSNEKRFYVVDHSNKGLKRSDSRENNNPPNSSTSLINNNNNKSRSQSSQKASSRSNTDRVLKSGHWILAGPQVLIKTLGKEDAREALQIKLIKSPLKTFHEELKKAAHIFNTHSIMDGNSDIGSTTNTTPRANAQPSSNSNAGETILPHIPDSPGSHSHYGEFYWDTNGETTYNEGSPDNYDFDAELLSLGSGGGSRRARLGRTQQDLNKFKQRIDLSVEQQKEYSDLMNQMQNKLSEYRRHIAELEGKLINQRAVPDTSLFPLNDSGFIGDTSNTYISRIYTGGGGGVNMNITGPGGDTGLGDVNSNYEVLQRLDEERRRADDIRIQLDTERQNNEHLQRELECLNREFERENKDKERYYNRREKNLVQYLSDEQKKMLDLWVELQRIRKQFNELKVKTEFDLESQRNEFNRMNRHIQGLTRTLSDNNLHQNIFNNADGGTSGHGGFGGTGGHGGGNVFNHDSVFIEIIKRIRDSGRTSGSDLTHDFELLSQLRNRDKNKDDADLQNQLMKKYEEALERNIELESKGDEDQRKLSEFESELKRTKDKLNDAQTAIRKMHDISINVDRSDSHKRARSLSPGSGVIIQPAEAFRTLRNVLREKNNEIQQLERTVKASDKQVKEFMNKFENTDSTRRRLDKLLDDAKREISNQQKLTDEAERNIRRLEDKVRGLNNEKDASEKARKFLEEELHRLQELFKKNTTDDARKARDEAEEFANALEDDYKNRIVELNRRIEQLLKDNARIRGEIGPLKDKYRDFETEHQSTLRKLEDKENQLKFADDIKKKTLGDYEVIKNQLEVLRNELDLITNDNDALRKNALAHEQQIKELKTQRDDYHKQRDDISRQVFDIKHKLDNEKKLRDDADKKNQVFQSEIEKNKETITDYECQLLLIRRHNDELDTQLKNGQAKTTSYETEIESNRKEIEKLNELNQRLQREKQEILEIKHKTETDVYNLKEQIRKLEKELEKLQIEIKTLEGKEERAHEAHAQQVNRIHLLQKDLKYAKSEVKELQDKIARLEKDHKDSLARIKNGAGGLSRSRIVRHLSSDTPDTSGNAGGSEANGSADDAYGGLNGIDGRDGHDNRDGAPGAPGVDGSYADDNPDDRYYDHEISKICIKEINDKWKLQVEKLENEKDQLEAKIRELEDQLNQINRGTESQEAEITDLKRKHQNDIDRLKNEITMLNDKHQNDVEDERESYQKQLDAIKLLEEKLQEKLANAEKRLADALNTQNDLERENREYDDKFQSLTTTNKKIRDEFEDARNEAEQEIQKWKNDAYSARSELKTLEAFIAGLKTQLTAANERNATLNKNVNDNVAKIRDLNSQIRKLDEDLTEARSNLNSKDLDLDSAFNRLHQLEEQLSSLFLDHTKNKNDLEATLREKDMLESNNGTLTNEVESLKKRVAQLEDTTKEQKHSLDVLKAERERLQNAFREKSKLADHLHQLAQQFDSKISKIRKELSDTSDKLITSDTEGANLRTELTRLQQELDFSKDQMVRKNDEYATALQDLANNYRFSEDARLNATQELETRKYELADLTSRLDSTEQRLNNLQQEYIHVESERELFADALRRFQNTINRVMTLNRFLPNVDIDNIKPTDSNIDSIGGNSGADDSEQHDESSSNLYRSIPFPPGEEYGDTVHLLDDLSGGAERYGAIGGGTDGAGGACNAGAITLHDGIDVSRIENTLQHLMGRINRLQRDRDKYREELNCLKKKTSETHTNINKRETRYKTIEENLESIEDEKRALEAHLNTAKQLLRSQDEALKQRDEERRNIKSKLVTTDLQVRGKEAQIRHLNKQLKNLRRDFDTAHEEIRSLRDKKESTDSSQFQLESKLRDHENELQRLHLQLTNVETDKQSYSEKIKELEGQLRLSKTKVSDLREDTEKLRRDLLKAENLETDLRNSLEQQSRATSELVTVRDQLTRVQNELSNTISRKTQLDAESVALRSELRDYKQRVSELNNRVSDLQRQLHDVHLNKNHSEDRILELEKTITAHRTGETDLRQQLELFKIEKKSVIKETEELKQRLATLEGEKGTLGRVHDQWKREKQVLLKKIEILENEKRRTDAAICETALQREAIEKSLNAMERENRELYKNCAQLQQQIAQLEMENGNRILELTNKQREEQERQITRIRNEKAQIERIIENRERTSRSRIKQLEDQLALMRDQLESERRRRRGVTDRQIITDIARIGGPSYLGIRNTTNYHSVLPADSIDSATHRFVRSTFASNPLTPPRGSSTPAGGSTLYEESVLNKNQDYERDHPADSLDSSQHDGSTLHGSIHHDHDNLSIKEDHP